MLFFNLLFISLNASAGFFQDLGRDIASPVTTEAKYYLLSGVALTSILVLDGVEDSLGHDVQNDTVREKPLGSFSVWGDLAGQMVPNAIYLSSLYGMYYFTDNLDYRRKSFLMFRATLYSGLMATLIKNIVREPRPNSDNRDSFPSGHTTSAFAFASVIGAEHEWYWGLAAYTMAGFVALSRINDNAHRLHDVAGGATLGMVYGLGLSYVSQKNKTAALNYYIYPSENGVLMGYRSVF